MHLKIDPEFQALIPPLRPEQRAQLRENIARHGRILDPIKVWDGGGDCLEYTIIDGHNRWQIWLELTSENQRLPSPEIQVIALESREDVKNWMRENQRGRRNLSPDQQMILDIRDGIAVVGQVTPRCQATQLLSQAPDLADSVIAGDLTLKQAWNAWRRRVSPPAPPRPRAPRGPSGAHAASPDPNVPAGHELRGQSTLSGPDGSLKGRWDKTGLAPGPALYPDVPEGHHVVKTTTARRGDGQVSLQYVTAEHEKAAREKAKWDAWERHAELYRGLADPVAAPAVCDDDLIALYPLGDPHIGMMAWGPDAGENFDLKIAVRELLACVRLMVAGAPAARHAIVTNLGDFLHAQSDEQRTPGHGHKLDVDGRFAKVLDAGHALLRGIVDAALERHEHVTVRNLPGNHDPQVAAELAMWLRAVYEREPRVTVADAFSTYQFDHFGANLFGWAHGDGAKAEALPLLMANAQPDAWGAATERVWHTGHVHHLTRKEYTGCVVETHRTMAAKDFWHASKGYSAKRSLQVITYHRKYGEIARNTVGLSLVRDSLK